MVEWEPPTSQKANITGFNTQLLISTTPNTQYTITVAAIAKVGTGQFYLPPMSKTTSPAAAGPVLNLNVNILPPELNSDSASIDASWESPCLTSGTFDYYLVKLNGKREQFPHHIFMQKTSDTKISSKTVKYEYNYTLQVQTHYSDVQSMGVARVHHFKTEATTTSPSLEGSEPEQKKFISPELVTLAFECSEDFPPPPDDLVHDKLEYENCQREEPVFEDFPPPISDEEPEQENFPPPISEEQPEHEDFPPPISDEEPEYKNFPIENEPENGNFVGSLIDISSESKKLHSSSAEMNSYPMIASEDSDKETVL
ncbi:hypothetical protein B566_EDAN011821 [Ephemera danica]|nr:hypothetical protein B566_EDAN011821 [Ephemera danica]